MRFITQQIPDVVLIKPEIHHDQRGYFVETFRQAVLEKAIGHKIQFVQENESQSSYGVLRGLHYQLPPASQSKLVRVSFGCILDIAVDIRRGSQFFGQYVGIELSEKNKYQLFIPRGFAHGFVVLSEEATIIYKVDNYYSPEYDRGLAFNDQQLAIDWQLPQHLLKLSAKDTTQPSLLMLSDSFDFHTNYYE